MRKSTKRSGYRQAEISPLKMSHIILIVGAGKISKWLTKNISIKVYKTLNNKSINKIKYKYILKKILTNTSHSIIRNSTRDISLLHH